MPWKTDVLFLACCVAWLICLPVLTVVGLISLVCYAIISLFADCFSAAPETDNARETAQHLCFGDDEAHLS